MKWTKLEYGKWPEGEIVMRIKDNKDIIHFVHGYIGRSEINNEIYFYDFYGHDGFVSKLSIDSIYDTEPHYIALNEIEMP